MYKVIQLYIYRLSVSHSIVSYSLQPHELHVTCQAPLSMEFSRQEYWSGLPFPSPGDLSDPESEPRPPALQADSVASEPPGKPIYVCVYVCVCVCIHIYIYIYIYI